MDEITVRKSQGMTTLPLGLADHDLTSPALLDLHPRNNTPLDVCAPPLVSVHNLNYGNPAGLECFRRQSSIRGHCFGCCSQLRPPPEHLSTVAQSRTPDVFNLGNFGPNDFAATPISGNIVNGEHDNFSRYQNPIVDPLSQNCLEVATNFIFPSYSAGAINPISSQGCSLGVQAGCQLGTIWSPESHRTYTRSYSNDVLGFNWDDTKFTFNSAPYSSFESVVFAPESASTEGPPISTQPGLQTSPSASGALLLPTHASIATKASEDRVDPARISCTHAGCQATFRRGAELRRHLLKHGAPRLDCPVADCSRKFYRPDKRVDHMRNGHKLSPPAVHALLQG